MSETMPPRVHRISRIIAVVIGGVAALIACPLIGFAVLGFFGILADVSVAENRQFGLMFLGYATPFAVTAAICLLAASKMGRDGR